MGTLQMLKTDLGITTTAYDLRLQQYLTSAQQMIEREGVKALDLSVLEDAQLVVMYAAWMWRRRDSQDGMPRMLRWALNNRIFAEKMKEEA
ncbi:MAG: phage head-tail connector protein [Oscillospiraceae bacterium]|nr:phage head-tail connector protein [Oscillospiraceae bacterium]